MTWKGDTMSRIFRNRKNKVGNYYHPPKNVINNISIEYMKLNFVKVQKRSRNVEAFQISKEWLNKMNERKSNEFKVCGYTIITHNAGIIISTLEGEMNAKIGDWIIKGVESEIYSCDKSIFNKSYKILEKNNVRKN